MPHVGLTFDLKVWCTRIQGETVHHCVVETREHGKPLLVAR